MNVPGSYRLAAPTPILRLSFVTKGMQADLVAQQHRREFLIRCRGAALLQGTMGEVTARFLTPPRFHIAIRGLSKVPADSKISFPPCR